ncbi:MAG: hypothetical protein U0804_02625 [Gemmataceae bacterium]
MKELEAHPFAGIFPMLIDADLDALADDIAANGLHHPIWLYEGKVLDGRHRYRACLMRGVDPRFEEYAGHDPLGFVLSRNLRRRHLNESQRAMVATKIAAWHKGDNQHINKGGVGAATAAPTREQAAQLLNVSPDSIDRAKAVRAKGVPELVTAVESGEVTVSAGAEVANRSKAEQKKAVKAGPKAVRQTAAKQRKAKKAKKAKSTPTKAVMRADDDGLLLTGDKPAEPENPPLDTRFMPGAARAVMLAEKFRVWKAQVVALRTAVRKEFPDRNEVMARRIDARGQFDAALTDLAETLDRNIPEHVCPDCCGTGAPEAGGVCKFCDGFGVVDRHHHGGLKARWKQTAPRLAALLAAAGGA